MIPLLAVAQWQVMVSGALFVGIVIGYLLHAIKRKVESALRERGWLDQGEDRE